MASLSKSFCSNKTTAVATTKNTTLPSTITTITPPTRSLASLSTTSFLTKKLLPETQKTRAKLPSKRAISLSSLSKINFYSQPPTNTNKMKNFANKV